MKKLALVLLLATVSVLLSGCLFPSSEREGTNIPYEQQLNSVQEAVDRFRENSGGLIPIRNRDADVDQYIKYPIDFSKIVPAYLPEIPSNAFEQGGVYQYVLMDVENVPTVKLVDLQLAEQLRSLNVRKGINGYVPIASVVTDNVYRPSYEAMGLEGAAEVTSPYSGRNLPIVVTGAGDFYVDYSMDLFTELQEYEGEVTPGEDIRFLLYDDSPIVPAYSLPYTVNEEGEPVFLTENEN
ncbi:hypothetical protein [Planococcus lenghuensis]|uniref:ABC transporter periplasmic binding protein yphF n=1 Tax=Planococcus lenghuensis TaxID=2213202 RepID=A0A1Q2KZS8_9BACL|nr:hypothetical protein [Planococcus lenghuensis]AQQ53634.1 hypothetical protein B0X71_11480 [Planococcus lenghuensis]